MGSTGITAYALRAEEEEQEASGVGSTPLGSCALDIFALLKVCAIVTRAMAT